MNSFELGKFHGNRGIFIKSVRVGKTVGDSGVLLGEDGGAITTNSVRLSGGRDLTVSRVEGE